MLSESIDGSEIGAVDDEISTLKYIADIKTELYEVESAENIYKQALQLATKTGQTKSLMDVLNHLCKLYSDIGNVQQAHVYTANMDSLVEVAADEQTKSTITFKKGTKPKGGNNTLWRNNGIYVQRTLLNRLKR